MTEISMTTFVDFVLASGTKRLTCVRTAKADYAQPYKPARDFYGALREAIVDMHQNQRPRESLDSALLGVGNTRTSAYVECIAAYKQWCGRKRFQWTDTFRSDWTNGGLTVKVNPELGMRINGTPYIIKLYFKGESPSKIRLETMFHLLRLSLPRELVDATPGILDVRRGNLFVPSRQIADIEALLAGEASAFQTIWDAI